MQNGFNFECGSLTLRRGRQEVHHMAKELSELFEREWEVVMRLLDPDKMKKEAIKLQVAHTFICRG